jgi:hypothetical protein
VGMGSLGLDGGDSFDHTGNYEQLFFRAKVKVEALRTAHLLFVRHVNHVRIYGVQSNVVKVFVRRVGRVASITCVYFKNGSGFHSPTWPRSKKYTVKN